MIKKEIFKFLKMVGWHFNNLMQPEDISKKLKTYAHSEFNDEKFSAVELIKKKSIKKLIFLIVEKNMKK